MQNTFILRQNISVPLSIRPLKFIDTPRLTYPGHDLSWHAVSRVSGTWHTPTRHVSRHFALWSATRRVSWNITALKIPRNYSFHAVQGEKHSSFANHWKLGKPRHFVTLRTVYYLLSDKFCVFSALDLQQNNNISLIVQIWFKTKIKQHILSRLICIKWYFDNIKCLSSVYFN